MSAIQALKQIAKLFVPPIVLGVKHWMTNGAAVKPLSLGARPDEQDIALYWDEAYANVLEEWGRDTVWKEIQFIFAGLTGTVLDIACGTGAAIAILNQVSALQVHGFDISDVLIKRAERKGIDPSRLRVADATKADYSEREFDYSYSIGSIEHFTEDGIHAVLRNAARYTKNRSFHMLPVNRDGINKGWEKTQQSYFNNGVDWWLAIFKEHFAKVTVLNSAWAALDQQGKWFVCECDHHA